MTQLFAKPTCRRPTASNQTLLASLRSSGLADTSPEDFCVETRSDSLLTPTEFVHFYIIVDKGLELMFYFCSTDSRI